MAVGTNAGATGAGAGVGANNNKGRVTAAAAAEVAARRRAAATPPLPLSGSEETFADAPYGTPRGVKNNNCYAYALGRYADRGGVKLQPGNLSGAGPGRPALDLGDCRDLQRRVMQDSADRAIYAARADAPCRAGFYKVMAFLDANNDYHWYKQHRDLLVTAPRDGASPSNVARNLDVPADSVHPRVGRLRRGDAVLVRGAGLWSHKQGFATGPLLKDACGAPIRDPRTACRDYGTYNYRTFCGAFCVRTAAQKKAAR
jgi:hypothetical protein